MGAASETTALEERQRARAGPAADVPPAAARDPEGTAAGCWPLCSAEMELEDSEVEPESDLASGRSLSTAASATGSWYFFFNKDYLHPAH